MGDFNDSFSGVSKADWFTVNLSISTLSKMFRIALTHIKLAVVNDFQKPKLNLHKNVSIRSKT